MIVKRETIHWKWTNRMIKRNSFLQHTSILFDALPPWWQHLSTEARHQCIALIDSFHAEAAPGQSVWTKENATSFLKKMVKCLWKAVTLHQTMLQQSSPQELMNMATSWNWMQNKAWRVKKKLSLPSKTIRLFSSHHKSCCWSKVDHQQKAALSSQLD